MTNSRQRIPISVVINTYNRAPYLAKTLLSLRRQTYLDFEVIVVNGPSTDATDLLLQEYATDLKIACCPDPILGISRNIGVNLAAGEIVAFIDDDAVPEETWLEKLESAYADPSVAAAGGYVFDIPLERIAWRICTCTRAGKGSLDSPPPVEAYLGRGADPFLYLSGCNMSFRREALAAIGGFNEAFAYVYDDVDVCRRIIDGGHRISLLEDAVVFHERAPNSTRDQKGVVRDLYPFFYARTVFSLQCPSNQGSIKKIVSRIKKSAKNAINFGRRQLGQGIFTNCEYEHFVQRIHRAIDDGIATGMRSSLFRTFEAPDSATFRLYPRAPESLL